MTTAVTLPLSHIDSSYYSTPRIHILHTYILPGILHQAYEASYDKNLCCIYCTYHMHHGVLSHTLGRRSKLDYYARHKKTAPLAPVPNHTSSECSRRDAPTPTHLGHKHQYYNCRDIEHGKSAQQGGFDKHRRKR